MHIALIRHPPVQIAPGICYGRTDLALSAEGMAALHGIAKQLHGFAAACVWTSPARRCVDVAQAFGIRFRTDERLRELDFGTWEGRAWDDVPRADLDRWAAAPTDFTPPGGECVAALVTRVRSFHATLCHAGEDCVVISHGGVLRVLEPMLRGVEIDLAAAAPALGTVQLVSV